MATVFQSKTLVNDISKQMLGRNAIAVTDSSSLLDFGNVVYSSATNVDLFYKCAVDRVARVEIGIRLYNSLNRKMRRDAIAWGMFKEKIRVKTKERFTDNPAYDIDSMQHSPYDVEPTTELIRQMYGKDLPVFSIEDVLPGETQLRTAFTSTSEFDKLISVIRIEIQNELETAWEALDNEAVATLIAYAYKNGKTQQKQNVVKQYNTEYGKTLTNATCRHDADYLKYRVQLMSNIKSFMTIRSVLYNSVENYASFTSEENLVIEMLTEAASDVKKYMTSDTYWKDLVALPGYIEVPCWQGLGDGTYADHAKIAIKHDEIGEADVVINNVFAVMRDIEAVGTYFDIKRSWAKYNERDDVTPFGIQVLRSYAADPYESCVVFYDDADEV